MKLRQITVRATIVAVLLGALIGGLGYAMRYTETANKLLEKLPDRFRRKAASLFLKQPTPDELAQLPAVLPEKVAMLKGLVKVPSEFDVTIFATPPAVNYPVFVAAAPDGTLYVSSDGNGSLDHKPGRGRILRVRDTNGDGQADEVRAFVPNVDTPRGLVWDQDRLYLLHPPNVSAYFDNNGDGVADEEKILVTGVGFGLKDRPGDHSANGLTLGIDGWIYAAIGDFGILNATGSDGRKLQLRGGGVIRFRTDGSGLELWTRGTRNIVEVPVSPLLSAFARDNSGDDGWDVRFHHITGLSKRGWPSLFRNFSNEVVAPIADYGGGSGCGAAWISEPTIPSRWNDAAFTADWGREAVFRHAFTTTGATFRATQEIFCEVPRVTDLDVDARGAIYVASWHKGGFMWTGRDVGFIARLTPKDSKALSTNVFQQTNALERLKSPSHRIRLAAQRTLLRQPWAQSAEESLRQVIEDRQQNLDVRLTALFTHAQWKPDLSFLTTLTVDEQLSPWALRAVGDIQLPWTEAVISHVKSLLRSTNATARLEAVIALARKGDSSNALALVPLLTDPDPLVAHSAAVALSRLNAIKPCLDSVEHSDWPLREQLYRVVSQIHRPEAVATLTSKLHQAKDFAERRAILTALCRLHFREGEWRGDSWGTRPDTRGPYFQFETWSESSAILATLHREASTHPEEAGFISREMLRHRIPNDALLDALINQVPTNTTVLGGLLTHFGELENVPLKALPTLQIGLRSTELPTQKASIKATVRVREEEAWHALLSAWNWLSTNSAMVEQIRDAIHQSPHLAIHVSFFVSEAAKVDGASSALADAILLKLASERFTPAGARSGASNALERGWAQPARKLQIMQASALLENAWLADRIVQSLSDPDPAIMNTARKTLASLQIKPEEFSNAANAPRVGELEIPSVLERVSTLRGDVRRGRQLFSQLGCGACHSVSASEPAKGPNLGKIANVYRKRELAEAILLPNKSLAQGFTAYRFELKDGNIIDGFVIKESVETTTVRTVTASEHAIQSANIVKRTRLESSLMPEGLVAGISLPEFASLLDYLQELSGH